VANPVITEYLRQILQIDEWAQNHATNIANGGKRSPELTTWATTTRSRLHELSETLKGEAPTTHETYREVISESILDLTYVERDIHLVSVRLGALMLADGLL
jgi:hypothetical protein